MIPDIASILQVTSESSIRKTFHKSLDKDGNVVEQESESGVSAEQAMRSHEMLLKLVNRKAVGHIKEVSSKALEEFLRPAAGSESEISQEEKGTSS